MKRNHHLMFAYVSVVAGLGSVSASAQVQIAGLETITVTARRTDEKLQDVPLQVSAYTSEMLKQVNVATVRDINNLTPSMNFQGASFGRAGGATK
jgi:iron complex outermembrane receptor protein